MYISNLLKSCTGRCMQTAKRAGLIDEYGQRNYHNLHIVDHDFILGYKGVSYSTRCPILFSFPYCNFEILNREWMKGNLSSKHHLFLVNPKYINYVPWENEDMTTMCLAIVPEFPNWKQQLWLIEEAVGDEVFFSYGDLDE